MPPTNQVRENLVKYIENNIPNFQIVSKKESTLIKMLSFLLFFNKQFMTRYVTTIYPRVYVPSIPWHISSNSEIEILAHEYVHLADRKRLGLFFNFIYLSPQILSVLSLGAFWNLWFLLFLLFLLPIPSPGRAWAEFRGYRMSMAVMYWTTGQKININFLLDQFTKSGYYWMWPFRKQLKLKFEKEYDNIKKDILAPELQEIKKIIRG